jgi:hypothetical protein
MNDFRKVIQAEIEAARQNIQQATAKYETLVAVLKKYERSTLAKNGRKSSIGPAPAAVPTASDDDGSTNKTQLVFDVVVKAHKGIKPAAICSAIRSQGVSIGRNYVYAVLGRLEKKGRVQTKNRKWYASATSKEGENQGA